MTRVGRGLSVGAAVLAFLVGFGTDRPSDHQEQKPTVTTVERCEEDEPCWDCATMGNHICGPSVADPGDGVALLPPVVVSAP